MVHGARRERRSLKYIRLAAYLAAQPSGSRRLELDLREIEAIVDDELPEGARFPSWWRNDERKMHSRAWLTAGWEVESTTGEGPRISFVRRGNRP